MPKIYKRNCNNCGELYKGSGKMFCSVMCRKESPEMKEIFRKANTGKSNPFYGKHHSDETKKKKSLRFLGNKSPSWKGGITKVGNLIRHLSLYGDWRNGVFKRDNYTCQKCGKVGGYLNAHHIVKMSDMINNHDIKTTKDATDCKLLWETVNGITFCKNCHIFIQGKEHEYMFSLTHFIINKYGFNQ